jgi:pSer/pThr/pTyr-binding forkhead associated (FHA) protein
MPHLQYTALDGKPTRLALVRMLTTIGSSRDSDLVIDSPDVAPVHATLTHEPGRYRLESTARANPFFVNGKKNRSLDLRHGDVFVVGDVELTFSSIDEAPAKRGGVQDESALQLAAMNRLQNFSRLLAEPADLDGLLNELIDQVVALTKASKGFLVLAGASHPDGSGYEVRVARNLEREPVDDPAELLSDDIIHAVISSTSSASQ